MLTAVLASILLVAFSSVVAIISDVELCAAIRPLHRPRSPRFYR